MFSKLNFLSNSFKIPNEMKILISTYTKKTRNLQSLSDSQQIKNLLNPDKPNFKLVEYLISKDFLEESFLLKMEFNFAHFFYKDIYQDRLKTNPYKASYYLNMAKIISQSKKKVTSTAEVLELVSRSFFKFQSNSIPLII